MMMRRERKKEGGREGRRRGRKEEGENEFTSHARAHVIDIGAIGEDTVVETAQEVQHVTSYKDRGRKRRGKRWWRWRYERGPPSPSS